MDRVSRGDRAALDLLYRRYSPVVFSICHRIVGDQGIAEDLLIEVFFELWRRGERYDPTRGAPLTYITTLARSRAIDRKRGKNARWATTGEGVLESMGSDGFRADPAPTPHESSVLSEQSHAVRAALSRLEEDHRKTLEMSYFEGLSHSQIATKLGKPLGTVKTHIRMGIIRMRELLRMDQNRD
jgi:RNA polymerase sigma-70 factor (ECF subfamily)